MQLFVNDTPVSFLRHLDDLGDTKITISRTSEETPNLSDLQGKVLITNVGSNKLYHYVNEVMLHEYRKVSFYFLVEDYDSAKQSVIDRFKVIDAAGGIVNKDDKLLMIHRFGIWDLPKGKRDRGEKFKHCAVREVEEETGVKVRLLHKVCITWHTYTLRRKRILKKTKWYAMEGLDDSQMAPQIGESIEKVAWMSEEKAKEKVKSSYRSVKWVLKQHLLKAPKEH